MSTALRIKDWKKHFEVSQSKRARSPEKLSWVAMPNKHDGKSYKRLLRMSDGIALYGAWQLIVQVASKCPERGVLIDEDGPIGAEILSLKTEGPKDVFEKALNVLLSKEIGWLEMVSSPSAIHQPPSAIHRNQDTDVTNETRRDVTNVTQAPPARKVTQNGLVYELLEKTLGLDSATRRKAGAMLCSGGRGWNAANLAALMMACDKKADDVCAFAKVAFEGKTQVTKEFDQYLTRAGALLKSFDKRVSDANE